MGIRGKPHRVYIHTMKPSLISRYKLPVVLAIALPTALCGFWLVNTSRAATETPEYKASRAEGKFEIRDYPELTVATTTMDGQEMNSGFRQLFKFITGGNAGAQKIQMTSPVLIDTAKDKKTMSFIMPKKAADHGLPKPTTDNVTLGRIKATRYAVLRFDGTRSAEHEKAATEKLKAWMAAQKIAAKGDPLFAYYDPPWTPTFLRRNEVLIRIDGSQE